MFAFALLVQPGMAYNYEVVLAIRRLVRSQKIDAGRDEKQGILFTWPYYSTTLLPYYQYYLLPYYQYYFTTLLPVLLYYLKLTTSTTLLPYYQYYFTTLLPVLLYYLTTSTTYYLLLTILLPVLLTTSIIDE